MQDKKMMKKEDKLAWKDDGENVLYSRPVWKIDVDHFRNGLFLPRNQLLAKKLKKRWKKKPNMRYGFIDKNTNLIYNFCYFKGRLHSHIRVYEPNGKKWVVMIPLIMMEDTVNLYKYLSGGLTPTALIRQPVDYSIKHEQNILKAHNKRQKI